MLVVIVITTLSHIIQPMASLNPPPHQPSLRQEGEGDSGTADARRGSGGAGAHQVRLRRRQVWHVRESGERAQDEGVKFAVPKKGPVKIEKIR